MSTRRPIAAAEPGSATPGSTRKSGSAVAPLRDRARPAAPGVASSSSPTPRSCSARRMSAWLRSSPTTSTASNPTTTPSATTAAVIAGPHEAFTWRQRSSDVRARPDVDGVGAHAVGARADVDHHVEAVGRAAPERRPGRDVPGWRSGLARPGRRCRGGPAGAPTCRASIAQPCDAHLAAADPSDRVDVAERAAVPVHPARAEQAVAARPDADGVDADVVEARRDVDPGVEAVPAAAAVSGRRRRAARGRRPGSPDPHAVDVDVHRDRGCRCRDRSPSRCTRSLAVLDDRRVDVAERRGRHGAVDGSPSRELPPSPCRWRRRRPSGCPGGRSRTDGLEAVVGAGLAVRLADVGPGAVGPHVGPAHAVDVDVDVERTGGVGVDRPSPTPSARRRWPTPPPGGRRGAPRGTAGGGRRWRCRPGWPCRRRRRSARAGCRSRRGTRSGRGTRCAGCTARSGSRCTRSCGCRRRRRRSRTACPSTSRRRCRWRRTRTPRTGRCSRRSTRAPPPQKPEPSTFHHPPRERAGGQRFMPVIVQQNSV